MPSTYVDISLVREYSTESRDETFQNFFLFLLRMEATFKGATLTKHGEAIALFT